MLFYSEHREPLVGHPVFCSVCTGQSLKRAKGLWGHSVHQRLMQCRVYEWVELFLHHLNDFVSRTGAHLHSLPLYTCIFMFWIELLGIMLIWPLNVEMLILWLFHWTPLPSSSRCTKEWQPTTNTTIWVRFLCCCTVGYGMRCKSKCANYWKKYNLYNAALKMAEACRNFPKIDAFLFRGKISE